MVSIGLVEAFRFSWDRRVVLGIFGFSRVFAEYNSAIPGETLLHPIARNSLEEQ